MRHTYTLILLLIFFFSQAEAKYTFWVVFTDKDSSHFSIENPSEFLNDNALQRRIFFNVPIDITDIPVADFYINRVESYEAQAQHASKWLNGAVFTTENPDFAQQVALLPFVKQVVQIKVPGPKKLDDKLAYNQLNFRNIVNNNDFPDYGASENQLTMLMGHKLHEMGMRGEGIDVAVMDNGFVNVNSNIFFDVAMNDGRINAGYNFVNNNSNVFTNGNHGSAVLSTMAGEKAGNFLGAAPKANYYLFITEDDFTEGIHEEINWALAAEMADTLLGLNVILSTSLGYSDGFDNPADEYTYADMDGNTTIITRAANLAASKGMLVVNSAGNSGSSAWRYITAPADGPEVLAVGAVAPDKLVTPFSSRGPNAVGDVKPNVMAQGGLVAVVNKDGAIIASNGTSFSCPIISGMAACLWQAFPEKSSQHVFKAIQKSAHLYNNPNNDYGYGIPNFQIAYELLRTDFNLDNEETFLVYPNPFESNLHVVFYFADNDKYDLAIFDLLGKKWYSRKNITNGYHILEEVSSLPSGNYLLRIKRGRDIVEEKLIKY
jgi:serine protease AprX